MNFCVSLFCKSWCVFKVFFLFIGVILCWYEIGGQFGSFSIFTKFYLLSVIMFLPRNSMSPINVLMGYYGLWFVLSPMFGLTYNDEMLKSYEYEVAIAMAFSTYSICLLSLLFGEFMSKKIKLSASPKNIFSINNRYIQVLYFLASSMIILIVMKSGGFSVWINNPGDAFLNRGGTGVYVILSHFFSIALAASVGLNSFNKKNITYLLIFITWLIITSPVHGSKFQISLLFLIAIIPWFRKMKTKSSVTLLMGLTLACIFFIGMHFRGFDLTNMDGFSHVLGYFSTLHNLALSIRDYEPGGLFTFFLPFNKFLTPFGLGGGVSYYDMNHLLTDIYYPEAWEIRATEQWPVETDLYLNFYFFGGFPLIIIYMASVGLLYGFSQKSSYLGLGIVSLLTSLSMISHLRGSLYNHTDFYIVPFMLIYLYLFRNVKCLTQNTKI